MVLKYKVTQWTGLWIQKVMDSNSGSTPSPTSQASLSLTFLKCKCISEFIGQIKLERM